MQIIRKKLSADEFQAPGIRYNPGTDTVQTLVGGIGGTWVDTPAADPRTNPSALLPPRTTGDPRCDAAANMTAKVKSIVDYYLATAEQALFVSGVLTIIAVFFPLVGLIAEALWAIADVLVGLGVVVVGGAMTGDVYDHLTCYFYAQLDSSGQLDQTGLDNVLSAVSAGESGTVYDVIAAVFSGLGWVGIDNAGATGSETGHCGACGSVTYHVSSNGATTNTYVTTIGKTYQLTISGTFNYHYPGNNGDAQWNWLDGGEPGANVLSYGSFGTYPFNYGILIDLVPPSSLAYESTHVYIVTTPGTGAALGLVIGDSDYTDNAGELTVVVEEL